MLSVDVAGHLCIVSVTDNYNIARTLTKSLSLGGAAGICLRRIITELFCPFKQIMWLDMNKNTYVYIVIQCVSVSKASEFRLCMH